MRKSFKFAIVGYTDGACKKNPGIGGWGWWYRSEILSFPQGDQNAKGKIMLEWSDYGGDLYTTNNKMELTAMIECVKALPDNSDATIYTDSKYVLNSLVSKAGDKLTIPGTYSGWIAEWIRNGWHPKPKKNVKLFQSLDTIIQKYIHRGGVITLYWIKGHSKNPGNERADMLANKGVDLVRNQ